MKPPDYNSNRNSIQSVKCRLHIIVENLKSDWNTWRTSHISGWKLVTALAKINRKILTLEKHIAYSISPRGEAREIARLASITRELKFPTQELTRIISSLSTANNRTRRSLNQFRLWANMKYIRAHVFYKAWKISDFLDFVEKIMRLYDAEYEIKEMVAEDMTVLRSHIEIRRFCLLWQTPRHALTKEFNKLFHEFNVETSSAT